MSIPLELPDKAGQGALWEQTRTLVKVYLDLINKGDTHEAKRVEWQLNKLRSRAFSLHSKKEPPHGSSS